MKRSKVTWDSPFWINLWRENPKAGPQNQIIKNFKGASPLRIHPGMEASCLLFSSFVWKPIATVLIEGRAEREGWKNEWDQRTESSSRVQRPHQHGLLYSSPGEALIWPVAGDPIPAWRMWKEHGVGQTWRAGNRTILSNEKTMMKRCTTVSTFGSVRLIPCSSTMGLGCLDPPTRCVP